MLVEHERNYGLDWMLSSPYSLGTQTELWFGHACSSHCILLEHERNYGWGMDALVTVFFWNTNGNMADMDALVTVFSWNGIMV